MQFPIQFSFKTLALAPQITASDASGAPLLFVRQKMFKLKEKIEIFADSEKAVRLGEINADRIIDFSANYTITDASGNELGAVRRRGMRSLWKAHYEITTGGSVLYTVREKSAMTRILDGLFQGIPVLGVLSGYVFHPVYEVTTKEGTLHYNLRKMPALFEGKFSLEKVDTANHNDILVMFGLMMTLLLERARG